MSDIRKYINLIETYEHIDEAGDRKASVEKVNQNAYNIALHISKLKYYNDYTTIIQRLTIG